MTFASIAKGNAMLHAIFSHFTNDELDAWRTVLVAVYLVATCGVVVGVILEGKRFSESWQDSGWLLLVVSLSIETLSGGIIFWVDAEIQTRFGSDIASLDHRSRKANDTAGSALRRANSANDRLSALADRLEGLSRQEVDVANNLSDLRSAQTALGRKQGNLERSQSVLGSRVTETGTLAQGIRSDVGKARGELTDFENAISPREFIGRGALGIRLERDAGTTIGFMGSTEPDAGWVFGGIEFAANSDREYHFPIVRVPNDHKVTAGGVGLTYRLSTDPNHPFDPVEPKALDAAHAICVELEQQGISARVEGVREQDKEFWPAGLPVTALLVRVGPNPKAQFFANRQYKRLGLPSTPSREEFEKWFVERGASPYSDCER